MKRQNVNDRRTRPVTKVFSKQELFEACDNILAMQNATKAADKRREVQNSTSATESVKGQGGSQTGVKAAEIDNDKNGNANGAVAKPVYIPEKESAQNAKSKRIPEGEELAKVIVKDEGADANDGKGPPSNSQSRTSQISGASSKSPQSSGTSQNVSSSTSQGSSRKSPQSSGTSQDVSHSTSQGSSRKSQQSSGTSQNVSHSTSHSVTPSASQQSSHKSPQSGDASQNVSQNASKTSTKLEAVDLEEKSGRKLQSLEQENDNLGFDEIDFGKTIRPGLGKDEVDSKSIWSEISYYMKRDFRYYFQHPYSRLFIAYFVTICNFLIFAEDPVAHSRKVCNIPVVGNVYALVVNYYPPNAWSLVKVVIWLIAIIIGMLVGKLVFHRLLLGRVLRLRMFRDEQGSWMIMFMTTIVSLFIFSYLLNLLYLIGGEALKSYVVSGYLGIENATFMKAAACGTWMGDFVTAWMVTDMMLQDKLYPGWAVRVRRFWNRGNYRIILFWVVWVTMTVVVVLVISTDWVSWDSINHDILVSNEVSRAYLASFILIMDLLIVMQDWDFPHFESNFDVKLPGLNTSQFQFELPKCLRREEWRIFITGKWFNYGIIFLVMILDLNMWKNQIFYAPYDFGQYTDYDGRVITVTDKVSLSTHNASLMTYEWREANTNPLTNRTYAEDDFQTNSRFYDYNLVIKATAFIPAITAFIVFGLFIWWYGRYQPDPNDPHAGRLFKRKKRKERREAVTLTKVQVLGDSAGVHSGYTNKAAEVGEGKF